MTVDEAIVAAEKLLPGASAPEGNIDPRWQAISKIGEFLESDPETVWPFIVRWGSYDDEDLRTAIATCLLEHLLGKHFDAYFPLVEDLAKSNSTSYRSTSDAGWNNERPNPR
jgi:hypothetical protein